VVALRHHVSRPLSNFHPIVLTPNGHTEKEPIPVFSSILDVCTPLAYMIIMSVSVIETDAYLSKAEKIMSDMFTAQLRSVK
jgi:hypothetical protein